MRAREIGLTFDGISGPENAITDIVGVQVGHVTLVEGDNVRTGVSAVLPLGRDGIGKAIPAGWYSLNGNGELTGTHWITETGGLSGPVMVTNTHAVGPVHRGVIDWTAANRPAVAAQWLLPVVAETWDGYLNDINGPHITPAHAVQAIDTAESGPVAEGSVGGGTGMNCYGFSGGVGTASRLVEYGGQQFTVGAYIQANFGGRKEIRLSGTYLGDLDVACPIDTDDWFTRDVAKGRAPAGAGSVIVIIGTDAPMLPTQCTALARRVPLGLARTGTTGSHFSGDLFLAWSTAGAGALNSSFPITPATADSYGHLSFIEWGRMDAFYAAVVHAVEEAVANALINNVDMTGREGHFSPALPHDLVRQRLASK